VNELDGGVEEGHKLLALLQKSGVNEGTRYQGCCMRCGVGRELNESIGNSNATLSAPRLVVHFNAQVGNGGSAVRALPLKKIFHFARAIDNSLRNKIIATTTQPQQ
jgi:hypothetical protein